MSKLQDESYHSKDAEQSIMAALFAGKETAAEAFDRAAVVLKSDDFYFSEHRLVFEAFAGMVERGQEPDPVMLAAYLKSLPTFNERVRSAIEQAAAVPFALENVGEYAAAVVEKSNARRMRASLDALAKRTVLIGGDVSSKDIANEMDSLSMQFEERRETEQQLLQPPSILLAKTIQRLENVESGEFKGKRFGISDLDDRLGPMVPGDLIILTGRPSMGKTAAMLEVCVENGVRTVPEEPELIAIFSLEMEQEKLGFRMLANIGGINHDHLRKSKLDENEWGQLTYAIQKYQDSNIRVDCDPTLTPAIMRSKLRTLVRATKQKIGLILVDYLQLMDADGVRSFDNRNAEITYISRNLKKMGKEFGCPVIALSQLNRSVEQRPNKRPMMSDLRESGAIEQDADVIIAFYRDEYYNPDSEQKGLMEWIILKARDAELGTVMTEFNGAHQRIKGVSRGSYGYESKYGD